MSELSTTLLICVHEARAAIDPAQPIEEQARAAMNAAKSFWLSTDDDLRFRGAIGGLLLANKGNEEITERIATEISILRNISAATSGIAVDFGRVLPGEEFKPIGLHKLWLEIRDG